MLLLERLVKDILGLSRNVKIQITLGMILLKEVVCMNKQGTDALGGAILKRK